MLTYQLIDRRRNNKKSLVILQDGRRVKSYQVGRYSDHCETFAVAADWLEERGDTAAAELLRAVQPNTPETRAGIPVCPKCGRLFSPTPEPWNKSNGSEPWKRLYRPDRYACPCGNYDFTIS